MQTVQITMQSVQITMQSVQITMQNVQITMQNVQITLCKNKKLCITVCLCFFNGKIHSNATLFLETTFLSMLQANIPN